MSELATFVEQQKQQNKSSGSTAAGASAFFGSLFGGPGSSGEAGNPLFATDGGKDPGEGEGLAWFSGKASSMFSKGTAAFANVKQKLLSGEDELEEEETPPPTGFFQKAIYKCGSYLPGLSKKQRLAGFGVMMLGSLFCFASAIFMIPIMFMQPRKFLLMLTFANIFAMLGFVFLKGPSVYRYMFSDDRTIVTAVYMGSTVGTMYSMLVMKSGVLTIALALIQLGSVFCYLWTCLPGGSHSLRFMGSLCARTAGNLGSAMV